MTAEEPIENLIERSSLGSKGARQLRSRTTKTERQRIKARQLAMRRNPDSYGLELAEDLGIVGKSLIKDGDYATALTALVDAAAIRRHLQIMDTEADFGAIRVLLFSFVEISEIFRELKRPHEALTALSEALMLAPEALHRQELQPKEFGRLAARLSVLTPVLTEALAEPSHREGASGSEASSDSPHPSRPDSR